MYTVLCHRIEGGELFDRIVSTGRLSESTAKLFFYQMVLAVNVSIVFQMARIVYV